MFDFLEVSTKIYVLFAILFLLFIYIPQVFREDNSFFFAIFKFYFVMIPVMLACAGVFGMGAGPVAAIFGIFMPELAWVTYLYLYCFCLYLFVGLCEIKKWNYQKW